MAKDADPRDIKAMEEQLFGKPKISSVYDNDYSNIANPRARQQSQSRTQSPSIRPVGIQSGNEEIQKATAPIMKQLGYSIDALSRTVTKAASVTAQAAKDMASNLNSDLEFNRSKFTGMMVARHAPLFGYMAMKFTETSVFRNFDRGVRNKMGDLIDVMKGKIVGVFSTLKKKGVGGIIKDIMNLPFKAIENIFKGVGKFAKFMYKLPFKAIGMLAKNLGAIAGFIIKLPFKLINKIGSGIMSLLLLPAKIVGSAGKGLVGGLFGGKKKEATDNRNRRSGSANSNMQRMEVDLIPPSDKTINSFTDPITGEITKLRFSLAPITGLFSGNALASISKSFLGKSLLMTIGATASGYALWKTVTNWRKFGFNARFMSDPKVAPTFLLGEIFSLLKDMRDSMKPVTEGIGDYLQDTKDKLKSGAKSAGKTMLKGADRVMFGKKGDGGDASLFSGGLVGFMGFGKRDEYLGKKDSLKSKIKDIYTTEKANHKTRVNITSGNYGNINTQNQIDILDMKKNQEIKRFEKVSKSIVGKMFPSLTTKKHKKRMDALDNALKSINETNSDRKKMINKSKSFLKMGALILFGVFKTVMKFGIGKWAKVVLWDFPVFIAGLTAKVTKWLFKKDGLRTLFKKEGWVGQGGRFAKIKNSKFAGRFAEGGKFEGIGTAFKSFGELFKAGGKFEKVGAALSKSTAVFKSGGALEGFGSFAKAFIKFPFKLLGRMLLWLEPLIDGIKGLFKSKKWNVSKTSAFAGSLLGGTKSGMEGMKHGMIKWGLFGIVGGPPGIAVGIIVGGLLGYIGGENIAKVFKLIGKEIKNAPNYFKNWGYKLKDIIGAWYSEHIKPIIDPIVNVFKKVGKEVNEKWTSMTEVISRYIPQWVKDGWNAMLGGIGALFKGIKDFCASVKKAIKDKIDDIKNAPGALTRFLNDLLSDQDERFNRLKVQNAVYAMNNNVNTRATTVTPPRHHTGTLAHDEHLAILQKGEIVLPKTVVEKAAKSGMVPSSLLTGNAFSTASSEFFDTLLDKISDVKSVQEKNGEASGGFFKYLKDKIASISPTSGFGWLSRRFESGGAGAGAISSGKGDYGGKSYGFYQLSSKTGSLASFINSSPSLKQQFAGLNLGSSEFDAKWKTLSKDPSFATMQHNYAKQKYLAPQLSKIFSKTGIDFTKRHPVLVEEALSTAIQYGPGTNVIVNALAGVDKNASDSEILVKIGQYKQATLNSRFKSSSPQVRAGVGRRINEEISLALSQIPGSARDKSVQSLPKAARGGFIAKDGPIFAHAGEVIGPIGEMREVIKRATVSRNEIAKSDARADAMMYGANAATVEGHKGIIKAINNGHQNTKSVMTTLVNNISSKISNGGGAQPQLASLGGGLDEHLNKLIHGEFD